MVSWFLGVYGEIFFCSNKSFWKRTVLYLLDSEYEEETIHFGVTYLWKRMSMKKNKVPQQHETS